MENFIYDIATRVYFGKGQVQALEKELLKYGRRVLLLYGGGSIIKNGIYDDVTRILKDNKVFFKELSGVEANPRIETVRKGVALCNTYDIDVLLPVGGGSVIDCAKAIGASYGSQIDAWELVEDASKITKVLPIIPVLTIAATGSEMDGIGVISDMEKREKRPLKHPLLRPKAAILDPSYTCSVPSGQTAAGIADILSHLMETYFSNIEGYMQERMCEALMKTCIHNGRIAYAHGSDYEARANLMWTATWAINDFLKAGRPVTWSVHAIEHQVSAYYDITHGVGLAILTPVWMEHVLNEKTVLKFAQFAREIWDVQESDDWKAARKGIASLREFFDNLNLPACLQEVGVEDDGYFHEMAEKALPYVKDTFYPLDINDIRRIYEKSFERGENE